MRITWVSCSIAFVLFHSPLLLAQDTMIGPADNPIDQPNLRMNHGGVTSGRDLWDNGPVDGVGGLANSVEEVFGARRTLLFDFVVPDGVSWRIDGMRWRHLWIDADPPLGTGLEMRIYDDAQGQPGVPISDIAEVVSYLESATGNIYFNRMEAESVASIEPVILTSGRYWTDATVVGPINNVWLTAEVIDNECWVDYSDFGGLQPGYTIFGQEYDLNGALTGSWFGGNYTLKVTGQCPGRITLTWNGANPNRRHAIIFGRFEGSTRIPNGLPCAGTILGVRGNVYVVSPPGLFSTGDGSGQVSGNVADAPCRKYLQLIEVGSCNTSNVEQIP